MNTHKYKNKNGLNAWACLIYWLKGSASKPIESKIITLTEKIIIPKRRQAPDIFLPKAAAMEEKSIAFYIGAVSIIDVMLPSPLIRLCDVDTVDYVNDRLIQCRFLFHPLFSGFHFRNVERKWT